MKGATEHEYTRPTLSVINGRSIAADAPMCVSSVLAQWCDEGPLVHEPTGFPTLDELTGGGPVYGSRWILSGAPDAGKTAFLIQLLDAWLARGVVCGLLAVDEDPSDIVTRLMQRRGFSRSECEQRERMVEMRAVAAELAMLRIYDSTWTIDRAADDLAAFAKGRRAALFVDSLQTATCEAEVSATSTRETVTARVVALRTAATSHHLIAIATSEMNRNAYRTLDAGENVDDMASAKESGAIEYSARVLLALRSVQGEPDLLDLRIAKNKHGPRGEIVRLKLNRRLQELTETDRPEPVDQAAQKAEAKTARAVSQGLRDAAVLAACLAECGGFAAAELTPLMKSKLGECGKDRARAARHTLGAAVVSQTLSGSAQRQALYLDGSKLPPAVVAVMTEEERSLAIPSRPR
jgi:KaiC/GvpD/RAD55 family RecA-like ATPase